MPFLLSHTETENSKQQTALVVLSRWIYSLRLFCCVFSHRAKQIAFFLCVSSSSAAQNRWRDLESPKMLF